MKNPNGLSDFLKLFSDYHFIVNESPLLSSADIGGRDDEEVYLNWVDEENGGEYFIPFSNLENAAYENGMLRVEDENGDLCSIAFFDLVPLETTSDMYELIWTNEHDVIVSYRFTVPKGTSVFTGFLEDNQQILNNGDSVENKILRKLGILFEPGKGESLKISIADKPVTVITDADL
jgi:hypothetical protein